MITKILTVHTKTAQTGPRKTYGKKMQGEETTKQVANKKKN
jgi:hypothetical protein